MEVENEIQEENDFKDDDNEYAWERKYEGTNLDEYEKQLQQKKNESENKDEWYSRNRIDKPIKRSIIRYLIISIDLSKDALEIDYSPNRLIVIQNLLPKFLVHFFEMNPLSMVSIICTKNRKTYELSPLSHDIKQLITSIRSLEAEGQQSLQSCLELSLSYFSMTPNTIRKEVLCFCNSITTCDPGDISSTLNKLVNQSITVSILSLGGEVYIYKEITKKTNGLFKVPQNKYDLINATGKLCFPPPLRTTYTIEESLLPMGFPTCKECNGICDCHLQKQTELYICPQCKSAICTIPSNCPICNLFLVDSRHISRSHNYIFPLKNFIPVNPKDIQKKLCSACSCELDDKSGVCQCPECHYYFCNTCDSFIHDSLFNCPMCLH